MKLMLVNSLNYGGLERTVYDLVKSIPFIVCCINEKGELGQKLEEEGFKVVE